MPTTEEQWDEVKELHDLAFSTNRSIAALSNKFKDLYRTKMPTGDPKIPDYIKRAKEIHQDFVERTDGSDGAPDDEDDDDNNLNGDDNEEDDDELANFFDARNMESINPSQTGSTNVPTIPPPPDDDELTTPCPSS